MSIDQATSAPRPLGWRLRILRVSKWATLVLLTTAAGLYWKEPIRAWWQQRTEIAEAYWIQPKVMAFERPRSLVVVDGVVKRDQDYPAWRITHPRRRDDPVKNLPHVQGLGIYTQVFEHGSSISPARVIFLHERQRAGGDPRLAAVTIFEHYEGLTLTCHVVKPGTLLRPPERLAVRLFRMTPLDQPEGELRMYAGRIDPQDSSALIIPFESGDAEGHVRLWLNDADRISVNGERLVVGPTGESWAGNRVTQLQFEAAPPSHGKSTTSPAPIDLPE